MHVFRVLISVLVLLILIALASRGGALVALESIPFWAIAGVLAAFDRTSGDLLWRHTLGTIQKGSSPPIYPMLRRPR